MKDPTGVWTLGDDVLKADDKSNWNEEEALTVTFSKAGQSALVECTRFFDDDDFVGADYLVGFALVLRGGELYHMPANHIRDTNVTLLAGEGAGARVNGFAMGPGKPWAAYEAGSDAMDRVYDASSAFVACCGTNNRIFQDDARHFGFRLRLWSSGDSNDTLQIDSARLYVYTRGDGEPSEMVDPSMAEESDPEFDDAPAEESRIESDYDSDDVLVANRRSDADSPGPVDSAAADYWWNDRSRMATAAVIVASLCCAVVCSGVVYSMCCKKGKKPISFTKLDE